MFWRFLEVTRYYSNMDGLLRAQFAYPTISFRHTVAPSAEMPSSFYPLNLETTDVETIYALGVTDGTAAVASTTHTTDLSQYFMLKKKSDKRVRGGVTFDSFMTMKEAGEFGEDKSLFEDKQMQAMFLQ